MANLKSERSITSLYIKTFPSAADEDNKTTKCKQFWIALPWRNLSWEGNQESRANDAVAEHGQPADKANAQVSLKPKKSQKSQKSQNFRSNPSAPAIVRANQPGNEKNLQTARMPSNGYNYYRIIDNAMRRN
jgi:hypothetical protein